MSTGISVPSAPGARVASQRPGPLPGRGPCVADRPQRPGRVRGQRADQPGDHRVGGHRPGQLRLARSTAMSARQSPPIASVMARSVMIFPGSCTARGARHRASPAARPWSRPVTRSVSASSNAPAWDTMPCAVSGHGDLGAAGGIFTWKVPSARRGQDPRQALFSQVKGTFYHVNDQGQPIPDESPRLAIRGAEGAAAPPPSPDPGGYRRSPRGVMGRLVWRRCQVAGVHLAEQPRRHLPGGGPGHRGDPAARADRSRVRVVLAWTTPAPWPRGTTSPRRKVLPEGPARHPGCPVRRPAVSRIGSSCGAAITSRPTCRRIRRDWVCRSRLHVAGAVLQEAPGRRTATSYWR